ncbi:hypothetical protein IMG5_075390 [Ichthyophthirius multifiliis]|uniref:Uncharacterized protein n=1 Tax=Ichthyophthirius multifiliis TaxID=5932 RepID=G0QQ51_ICHMU|nr:hypothetical protein IMG5_075390 [Ichthyophthirius multifiliis]EGR32655.1 hypothetical protein IMG5_075390 [Ichthyophthirius multifiliis]|eukprot:XP_004036641.1 hypothetical protein IMG5_075390 [Ichthyophthirius multifiliis]
MNNHDSNNYEQEQEEDEEQRINFYQIIKRLREDGENSPASRLVYVAYFNETLLQTQNIDIEKMMEQRNKDKTEHGKYII